MAKVLIDSNVVFDICNGFKVAGVDIVTGEIGVVKSNLEVFLDDSMIAITDRVNRFFQNANNLNFDLLNETNDYKKNNDAFLKLLNSNKLTLEKRVQIITYMEKNFNKYVAKLNDIKAHPSKFKHSKITLNNEEKIEQFSEIDRQIKFLDENLKSYTKLTETFNDYNCQYKAIKLYGLHKEGKCEFVVHKMVESELLCHIIGTKNYFKGNRITRKEMLKKQKAQAKAKGEKFDKKKFDREKPWLLKDKEILERSDVAVVLSDCNVVLNSRKTNKFIKKLSKKLQNEANMSKYKNRLGKYGDAILALSSYISGYDLVTNNSKDFMSVKKGLQVGGKLNAWVDRLLESKNVSNKFANELYSQLEKDQEQPVTKTSKQLKQKDIPKHIRIENMIFEEYNKFLRSQGKEEISLDNFRHGIVYGVADFIDTYDKVYKKPELFDSKVVETKETKTEFAYKQQEVLVSKKEGGMSK